MVNSGATFIVLAAVIAICLWVSMRQLTGNWSDIRFSLFSFLVNVATKKLSTMADNTKNWRPNILAFLDTKVIGNRDLIAFTHALNQNKGFLTYALCLPDEQECTDKDFNARKSLIEYLETTQIPAFSHVNYSNNLTKSLKEVSFNYGLGPLTPNTIALLYDPVLVKDPQLISYIYQLHKQQKNLIILKLNSEISSSFLEPVKGSTQKEIHLWWEGKAVNNFKLCLALSHLLQSSSVLYNANIRISALTRNEQERASMEREWGKYKKQLRMKNLNLDLIDSEASNILDHVGAKSKRADLTFLGLHNPKQDQLSEYQNYLENLFEQTKELDGLAFVLSADKINYGRIFFS